MIRQRWLPKVDFFVVAASPAIGQGSALTPPQAAAFMGTWVIEYTEPSAFKTTQTVRIFDRKGGVAASIQTGTFPPLDVTGIVKDGNMLVLIIHRDAPSAMRENGVPIWSVMTLTLDGETMKAALMLEPSQTIKRGTANKQ